MSAPAQPAAPPTRDPPFAPALRRPSACRSPWTQQQHHIPGTRGLRVPRSRADGHRRPAGHRLARPTAALAAPNPAAGVAASAGMAVPNPAAALAAPNAAALAAFAGVPMPGVPGMAPMAAVHLPPPAAGFVHPPPYAVSLDWTEEEQKALEQGMQKFPADRFDLVQRYVKVAAMLPRKSVRDVALRCRWTLNQQLLKKRKPGEPLMAPGAGAAAKKPGGGPGGMMPPKGPSLPPVPMVRCRGWGSGQGAMPVLWSSACAAAGGCNRPALAPTPPACRRRCRACRRRRRCPPTAPAAL